MDLNNEKRKLQVAKYYDLRPESYLYANSSIVGKQHYFKRKLNELLKELRSLPQHAKVLDVGCGVGDFCIELALRGYNVIGIDISKNRIKYANKTANNLSLDVGFMVSDGERLCFKDNSFYVVICISVLSHTPKPINLLKEIRRVLKPNGLAIIIVSNRLSPWFYIIRPMIHKYQGYTRTIAQDERFDRFQLSKMMKIAGFEHCSNMREFLFIHQGAKGLFFILLQYIEKIFEKVPIFKHLGGVLIAVGNKESIR